MINIFLQKNNYYLFKIIDSLRLLILLVLVLLLQYFSLTIHACSQRYLSNKHRLNS